MHKYRIRYRDPDPGCPVFSCVVSAYDAEHAEEKFREDGDDWLIVKIERVKEDR